MVSAGRKHAQDYIAKRVAVLRVLAQGVSTKDLVLVANHFPHLISEAVRELNGEVEYMMVENKDHSAGSRVVCAKRGNR